MGDRVEILLYDFGSAPKTVIVDVMKGTELLIVPSRNIFVFRR